MTTLAITIGDQVRLKFVGWPDGHPKGQFPLELQWANRSYLLQQGQSAYVPFELVKLYFGDPRSGAEVLKIQDQAGQVTHVLPRHVEVKRLYDLWLPSNVQFREFIPGDRTHFKDGIISDSIPIVEVWSLDGDRIPMVVDDPYGDERVAISLSQTEQERLQEIATSQSEQILDLKQQVQEMRAALGLGQPAPPKKTVAKKAEGEAEAPVDGVIAQAPKMVFNPKTNRVQKARVPEADPTTVDALPQDAD